MRRGRSRRWIDAPAGALVVACVAIASSARAGRPPDAGPADASSPDAATTTDASVPSASTTCPELARIEATYPADGATGVPRNTRVRVRYGPAASMTGVELLTVRDAEGSLVGGVITSEVRELVFSPSVPLAPGLYTAGAPDLGSGASTAFAFTVIDALDTAPPSLGAPEAIDWDAIEIEQICDVPSGVRYEMRIRTVGLADDFGTEHLELRAFHVGAPGTPPREIVRVPARDARGEVRVRLPENQAIGEVCFALATRDLAGSIGTSPEQACFHTIPLPFWSGCSVVQGRGARHDAAVAWALVVLASSVVARRIVRRRGRGLGLTRSSSGARPSPRPSPDSGRESLVPS
ncbi:MAG: Ig-like domain-containing protein [Deltaproteobacteria bacterium]|nr:Ig-like domain-containing protein [Deltaproteobacteria bacterium]